MNYWFLGVRGRRCQGQQGTLSDCKSSATFTTPKATRAQKHLGKAGKLPQLKLPHQEEEEVIPPGRPTDMEPSITLMKMFSLCHASSATSCRAGTPMGQSEVHSWLKRLCKREHLFLYTQWVIFSKWLRDCINCINTDFHFKFNFGFLALDIFGIFACDYFTISFLYPICFKPILFLLEIKPWELKC